MPTSKGEVGRLLAEELGEPVPLRVSVHSGVVELTGDADASAAGWPPCSPAACRAWSTSTSTVRGVDRHAYLLIPPAGPIGARTATVAAASRRDRYRRWVAATTLGELVGFIIPALVGAAVTAAGLRHAFTVVAMVLAGTGEGAVLGWRSPACCGASCPTCEPPTGCGQRPPGQRWRG
jgi:hypothetical protein